MQPSNAVQLLAEAGLWAPSADNTQPWQLRWNGQNLAVVYATRSLGGSFPSDHPATQIAMGALAENIIQAAAGLGIPVTAHHSTEPEGRYFEFDVDSASVLGRVAVHDLPLVGRHTNRLPYASRPVPQALLERFGRMDQTAARAIILAHRDRVLKIAELARLASEVRFQSRENHEWFHASLRFGEAQVSEGFGLDVTTLGLPPGGSLMLKMLRDWRRMSLANRAKAYAFFARIEAAPLGSAPAVIAIVGPSGLAATLDAGRLMQRVWIELNATGLAVQPFYVVAEQLHRLETNRVLPGFEDRIRHVHNETETLLELENETLHMLLRVGWPTRSPVRSRRLPLESILQNQA
jgi:hypothetical protein